MNGRWPLPRCGGCDELSSSNNLTLSSLSEVTKRSWVVGPYRQKGTIYRTFWRQTARPAAGMVPVGVHGVTGPGLWRPARRFPALRWPLPETADRLSHCHKAPWMRAARASRVQREGLLTATLADAATQAFERGPWRRITAGPDPDLFAPWRVEALCARRICGTLPSPRCSSETFLKS